MLLLPPHICCYCCQALMNLVEVALQLLSLRLHYLGDRKSVLAACICRETRERFAGQRQDRA